MKFIAHRQGEVEEFEQVEWGNDIQINGTAESCMEDCRYHEGGKRIFAWRVVFANRAVQRPSIPSSD